MPSGPGTSWRRVSAPACTASSTAARSGFGDVRHPPANEDAPLAPGDHYQQSKLEGERVAQEFVRDGRLPVVIFRPAGIYGPGDLRFLKLVRAIARRRFIMIGRGDVKYQMVYIDD